VAEEYGIDILYTVWSVLPSANYFFRTEPCKLILRMDFSGLFLTTLNVE
jgi:hypothetical protein